MLMDIFSSFDPNISSLSHMSILPLMLMTTPFLLMLYKNNLSLNSFSMNSILSIMNEQTGRTNSKMILTSSIIFSSLFLTIIVVNLLGMVPYFFSFTSHLFFSLSLGLPLWLALLISSAIYKPKHFVAHFLPGGAPDWLNPFLVLIELLSTAVRPITLSFRLAANMTAGHVVIALLATYLEPTIFNIPNMSMFFLMGTQAFYFLFEVAICLIQAYIFCLLLTLYADDHPM
uniref:ATP synthase subunit a n=1 Tax=Dinophilus gyrociliatus TaxID=120995 RepID=A0A343TAR5_9ANNE|nr:ATP synthase F0 subunit 6 [Dinophilus gyrociliatus]